MRLLSLCVLAFCVALIRANETVNVAIGQLFEFGLTDDQVDARLFPEWIGFDSAESKIFGVPRWDHFENVTLETQKGLQVEINTKAELEPCKDQDYVFVEVYDKKDLSSFNTAELRTKIKEFAETYGIGPTEVRAFTASDLEKYRRVTQSAISLDYIARPTQLVLWIRLGCGDFYEKADTAVYEKAAEQSGMGTTLRLGQGQVLKDNVLALQTATQPSASRTTRALIDLKPVLYNKINTIKCKRGILCQKWLPFNTFTDEDGGLINLKPKVYSSGEHPTFMNITNKDNTIVLEGIALETGTFGFRLEVRDHLNQVNDAPFNIVIEDTPKANHVFQMHMNSRIQKFRDQPSLLTVFVRRLTGYVGGRNEDVLIESLEPSPDDPQHSILRWSNHSLSRKSCQEKQINETLARMLGPKGLKLVHAFVKAMKAEFHMSSVDVQLRDTCAPGASTIQIANIRATTLRTPHGADSTSDSESGLSINLLIALIVTAIVMLLAVFILIYFLRQRKSPAHKKKKNSSDYATKGHPVVFPDEMPGHEDETNGANAAVNTPMLVAHEHPPLNPPATDSTTLHENPLYKPPAESAHSRTPAGQRLPPPYVAP